MISFTKLLKQKLLIDFHDLEPFNPGDASRALKWIGKFNLTLSKVGKRKTYMITEEQIHQMNKEAYKIFCADLTIRQKQKIKYEKRTNR